MPLGTAAATAFEHLVLGRPSKWFCHVDGCDGHPHEGMHWCEHDIDSDEHTWECRHARANQIPPVEFTTAEARIWLLMAGRGFGKTRTAAEWLADQMQDNPRTRWGIVAPTREDIQETCIEGESGLLRALGIDRTDSAHYNRTKLEVRLPNGAYASSFSAAVPEKVRGPNLTGAWLEEIASWTDRTTWDNLFPAIRRGRSQIVVSTTPKPVPLVKEFAKRDDGSVVITHGGTFDNRENLSDAFIAEAEIRWKGTRRERQELFGELLDDVEGALWTPDIIERTRGAWLPE